MNFDVKKTLQAMSRMHGRDLSPDAATMMLADLRQYPEPMVIEALEKCRKELRFFPSIADIVVRIQSTDGRPGVEEAWTMIPKDEDATVVWTSEMAEAWGVAYSEMSSDMIAARMAFKEKYGTLVTEARAHGRPVRWRVTLGHDVEQRKRALKEAVALGRLKHEEAERVQSGYAELSAPKVSGLLTGGTELSTVDPSKMIAKILNRIEAEK